MELEPSRTLETGEILEPELEKFLNTDETLEHGLGEAGELGFAETLELGEALQLKREETLELEVAEILAPVCRCGSGVEGKDEDPAAMGSPNEPAAATKAAITLDRKQYTVLCWWVLQLCLSCVASAVVAG